MYLFLCFVNIKKIFYFINIKKYILNEKNTKKHIINILLT